MSEKLEELEGDRGVANRKLPFSKASLVLIAICSLVYLLDGLSHSIMGPLAPAISRELGLSRAALGPVFSANLVGQTIGLIILPMLAPHIGHKKLIVISLLGFGFFQTVTLLASSGTALIALRLLTGIFLGGCLPSCLAVVADGVPPTRRGAAIMMLFTGYGSGAIVAGFLANLFVHPGGWGAVMAIVGGACLAAALIAMRFLDAETWRQAPHPGIAPTPTPSWYIVAPNMLLGTLMLWLMFVSALTINYCLNSWMPILLVDIGRSASLAALSVSIFAGGGLAGTLVVGPVIDRLGTVRTLVSLFTLSAILLFLTGRVLATLPDRQLMILLAFGGFVTLGAYGGINVVLAEYYPSVLRAVGTGWTKSVGRVGTIIAPVMIGLALASGVSQRDVMSLFAVPAMIAALALVVIGQTATFRRTGKRAVAL